MNATRTLSRSHGRLCTARKTVGRKNARRVLPANRYHVVRTQPDDLERVQLGETGAHCEIAPPKQPPCAECDDRLIEHPAIDAASRQIRKDVRTIDHRGKRVHVVAAAADVRENEIRLRMTLGETREIGAIRDLL